MSGPFITNDEIVDRVQSVAREYNRLRLDDVAQTRQQLADALKQLDAAAGAMEQKDREIRDLTGRYLDLLNAFNDERGDR